MTPRSIRLAALAFAVAGTLLIALNPPAAHAAIPGVTMPPANDGKLRIIAFGAHPDDCEIQVGGSGALWMPTTAR